MPGHKRSELYRRLGYGDFLEHIMDCDITEIPGADNLFQTEGIIRETQEKYQNLYGVKKSYLLINGTSRRADRRDSGICGAGRLADPGEKLP